MNTQINYSIVKVADLSLAMDSSKKSTDAKRKMDTSESTCWNHTVAALVPTIDTSLFDLKTDKDSIETLRKSIAADLEAKLMAAVTIPEVGKDRTGKDIKLAKKDGSVKWASWSETRRMFAYTGDIAKVVMHGRKDELLIDNGSDYSVAARIDILNACKEDRALVDKIKSVGDTLQKLLDQTEVPTDVQQAHVVTQSLTVNNLDPVDEMLGHIGRLDALLSVVDATEKAAVKAQLLKVAVKHFE